MPIKRRKKQDWRRVVGLLMVMPAIWIFLPPYFLPCELEFYFLLLLPFLGVAAVVLPFAIAAVVLPLGLWLMGLPVNGKGVKRAIKKVKRRRKK